MSTLSPLQTLSLHIVKLIVRHVVGSSRLVFDGIKSNTTAYKALLRPLMWVCGNFRAIALPLFCNCFELDLTDTALSEQEDPCLVLDHPDLGYPTLHLAKDLDIELMGVDVYTGKVLEMLSRSPYDGCVFPRVRNINFIFHSNEFDNNTVADPVQFKANIGAFAQWVKDVVPEVSSIWVLPARLGRPPETASCYFDDLVSQLLGLVDRIEFGLYSQTNIPVALHLDKLCDLVHLKFASEAGMARAIQLARRNASTLQSLVFESNSDIDVCGLVRDAAGCHVTYPHLLTLNIFDHSANSEQQRPVLDDVVPFPGLQYLVIKRLYPFNDDTLFRGNAATLKSLDMVLDSPTICMLCKYKVFTLTSHPELQCVNLTQDDIRLPYPFATAAEFMQFMLYIAPKASVREIGGYVGCTELATTLPLLENHTSIQVLTLVSIPLEFWDLIALIKTLPLLSDLHSSFPPPSFGAITATVSTDELPEFISANYAPMGKRFRCWHLKHYTTQHHEDAINCALLLALACPNFDYLVTDFGESKPFMKLMKDTIASDMFKEYAPRLRRLLFNGWRG
ncbi:hypothetical protein IW146_000747 [Coemansia sp. RSA 922]|nr:hypothetical protein H4S03_002292 [Coemansia sp. S3946]KAJ2117424.1 hypothetical protein IW146_000747 [Coemansia sp. RSA 922]